MGFLCINWEEEEGNGVRRKGFGEDGKGGERRGGEGSGGEGGVPWNRLLRFRHWDNLRYLKEHK